MLGRADRIGGMSLQTTYDCPLIVRELPDGTLVEEGTRAYLEAMLAQMLTSPTKSDQD